MGECCGFLDAGLTWKYNDLNEQLYEISNLYKPLCPLSVSVNFKCASCFNKKKMS